MKENGGVVLITGGLGYLGGRIAKHLLSLGFRVRIASSRLSPSVPGELSECEVFSYNFAEENTLSKVCKDVLFIIHLASLNAQQCNHDPEAALLVNSLGTLKLLNAAKKNGVKKFIYMSTAHVYGSPLCGEIDETMPTYPAHHYSITHKVSEDYVLLKDSDDCMERIVFRLTNGVGSPVTSDANCWMLVVNDLCKQVAMNSEIKLRSDGSLQRDFIPISLICSVVHSAIESNVFDREIVNISSGKSLTLHELAKLIAYRSSLVLGIKPPIKFNLSLTKEVINPLIISNNKLSCIFPHKIDTNLSDEIDRLLLNCRQWFQ